MADLSAGVNIDFLIKERDEYKREAMAVNAELFSVLKKQEYRSSEELALVPSFPSIDFDRNSFCKHLQSG